jgi:hypothetical protein
VLFAVVPDMKGSSTSRDETYSPSDDEVAASNSSDEDQSDSPVQSFDFTDCDEKRRKTKSAPAVRIPWSIEEREALFAACKGLTRPPGNELIRNLQTKCPSLQKRKISGFKSRGWHFIQHGR